MRENNVYEQFTFDRIDSLVYLDCVIKEVMRYHSPIIGIVRTLMADDCLPESGFQLRKGQTLYIPIHNLAHDPRYWSIDPERFVNEDKDHHPYALIPFGEGHRICGGRDLARFELKVIIARLMQFVTFGDGGPTVNAGGFTRAVSKPKHVGGYYNI